LTVWLLRKVLDMQDNLAAAPRGCDTEEPIMNGRGTEYVETIVHAEREEKPPVRDAIASHPRAVVMDLDALEVRLKAREREYTVVQGSSFALHEGRVLGLIGESGCGKSVTCLALMGLLEPDEWSVSGSARLRKREIDYANREELRQLRGGEISMIMQNPIGSFNPIFTVGEHFIETVCSHRGLSRKEAKAIGVEMLRRINIREPERVMSQYPFQLSGGMLQRVMIAIALFMKPTVLIADEPTTSLDVTVQYQILSELAAL
jgi:ABC-type dipeptide/oligopeptide/nickel transport system ATPase component